MEALGGIGAYSGGMSGLFGLGGISRSPDKEEGQQSPSRIPGQTQEEKAGPLDLGPEEEQKVQELKQRDREVKTHEQAHMAASGSVSVSGPNYEYAKGPDGQMYAVEGNVQIDTSKAEDPEATLAKARQIRAAATAPSQPSAADRKVAAKAAQMESEARQEMAEEKVEEPEEDENDQLNPAKLKIEADRAASDQARLDAQSEPAARAMRMASQAYEQSAEAAKEGRVALQALSLAV